jgi:hypothetical protein
LVDADRDALPFQTPAWTDALCDSGEWTDASRLYRFDDGRQVVLPLARRRRRGGNAIATDASMPPHWGFGGAVSAAPLSPVDAAAILDDLRASAPLRILLKPSPLVADTWAAAAPPGTTTFGRITHIIDLEGGFDHVFRERFHRNTRRYIRYAERSGLEIEHRTGGELVREFYAVYLRWVERRAGERHIPLPVARRRAEPYQRLELIARHMGPACRIWHARSAGAPVAALMFVTHGPHAVFLRGYSDLALARRTKANDLLQRLAIETACAEGCRYYHMGESGGVESLVYFKERFGAQAHAFSELRLERVPVTRFERGVARLRSQVEARLLAIGGSPQRQRR